MDIETLNALPPWQWPESARDEIERVLRDGARDAAERPKAVSMAGEAVVIDDELALLLLGLIGSEEESDEVRARAAIALGPVLELSDVEGFDDPFDLDDVPISERTFHTINDTLRQLYHDGDLPREVRRRVLEGSVRAPQKWHADAVRAAYASDDEEWRLTAVFCMEYVEGFEDEILESIASDNEHIEYHAVIAAGNWGVEDAWDDVARIIRSPGTDTPLLVAAIDAAVGIDSEEAEELIGPLLDSDDEDVVDAVREALAMAGALNELDFDSDDEEEW
jgi:hypothetical protein